MPELYLGNTYSENKYLCQFYPGLLILRPINMIHHSSTLLMCQGMYNCLLALVALVTFGLMSPLHTFDLFSTC